MNKPKVEFKKQIIRNAEDSIPKTVVVQQLPEPEKELSQIVVKDPEVKEVVCELAVPKLNSTNCVKKYIKKVEQLKPRKIKSLSDLPKPERATVDEKITKKVNFPFDQRLYKELISLKLIDKPVAQTVPTSYEPGTRDRVPKLEDFFVPKSKPEYYIPVHTIGNVPTVCKNANGLRLYQVMKTWESDCPD